MLPCFCCIIFLFVLSCVPYLYCMIACPVGLNCDQMEEGEQYNEYPMERNPNAYRPMRDYINLPWVSAPSYMVPSRNAPYGNAYNPRWGNHLNHSWGQYAPLVSSQYTSTPHPQPTQPTSPIEQAILNLTKLVGDFVGEHKTINS